jgi:hypothetical protein
MTREYDYTYQLRVREIKQNNVIDYRTDEQGSQNESPAERKCGDTYQGFLFVNIF